MIESLGGGAWGWVVLVLALAMIAGMQAWIAWRLGRNNRVLKSLIPAVGGQPVGGLPRVTVCIPARNEEATIARLLADLRRQTAPPFEVLVYDDASTDATAAVVERLSARDARIRLVRGGGPPPGWLGKTHGCWVLADMAKGDLLWFLDADVRVHRGALAALLGAMDAEGVSLVSVIPRFVSRGFWGRLLVPIQGFLVLAYADLASIGARRRPESALVGGACVLCRRDEYLAVGGHRAVRDRPAEDYELGKRWKQAGHRLAYLDGTRCVATRMYDRLGESWHGFGKNFYATLDYSPGLAAAFLWLNAMALLAPFVLLGVGLVVGGGSGLGQLLWLWVPLALSVHAIVLRGVAHRRLGGDVFSVLLHPIAYSVMMAIWLGSVLASGEGRGLAWKGRRLPPTPSASNE